MSKMSAAAPLSNFPVTEPMPLGSGYHEFPSGEYSLEASPVVVGRAPFLVAGLMNEYSVGRNYFA